MSPSQSDSKKPKVSASHPDPFESLYPHTEKHCFLYMYTSLHTCGSPPPGGPLLFVQKCFADESGNVAYAYPSKCLHPDNAGGVRQKGCITTNGGRRKAHLSVPSALPSLAHLTALLTATLTRIHLTEQPRRSSRCQHLPDSFRIQLIARLINRRSHAALASSHASSTCRSPEGVR